MGSYTNEAPSSKLSDVPAEGKWTTDFYDCSEDRGLCLKSCFCPCVVVGEIAEIVDGGTTSKQKACCIYSLLGYGCRAMYAAKYRRGLRDMFKLPEEPMNDCIAHDCCCICAITQEYRELRNRGVDPALGWQGNVQKWNREGITEPPIPTRMARC